MIKNYLIRDGSLPDSVILSNPRTLGQKEIRRTVEGIHSGRQTTPESVNYSDEVSVYRMGSATVVIQTVSEEIHPRVTICGDEEAIGGVENILRGAFESDRYSLIERTG